MQVITDSLDIPVLPCTIIETLVIFLIILIMIINIIKNPCGFLSVPDESYPGKCQLQNGTLIANGETVRFTDICEECTCSRMMLQCCGYVDNVG